MVFSGKFYIQNILLCIFLTVFEAGIAKNQNFGDNSFFFKLKFHCNLKWRSKIFCTIWEAENFFRVIFCGDKYVEKISTNLGGGSGVQLCSLDVELLRFVKEKRKFPVVLTRLGSILRSSEGEVSLFSLV